MALIRDSTISICQGTKATDVPKQFKAYRSGESQMLQFGFGRIVATIPRQVIAMCRYLDFSSDERCPIFFRAGGVVPVIASRRATLGSADDPVRSVEKGKQGAGVSEIISKTRRRTSARHRNRRFSKQNLIALTVALIFFFCSSWNSSSTRAHRTHTDYRQHRHVCCQALHDFTSFFLFCFSQFSKTDVHLQKP